VTLNIIDDDDVLVINEHSTIIPRVSSAIASHHDLLLCEIVASPSRKNGIRSSESAVVTNVPKHITFHSDHVLCIC
jgi:hypothetical protein